MQNNGKLTLDERIQMYMKFNKEELISIIIKRLNTHTNTELAKIVAIDDKVYNPNFCAEERLIRTNLVDYSENKIHR